MAHPTQFYKRKKKLEETLGCKLFSTTDIAVILDEVPRRIRGWIENDACIKPIGMVKSDTNTSGYKLFSGEQFWFFVELQKRVRERYDIANTIREIIYASDQIGFKKISIEEYEEQNLSEIYSNKNDPRRKQNA